MLDYYLKFADLLAEPGICSELDSKEGIPLEIWTTLAQVLADTSGYRLTLQASILQPSPGQRKYLAYDWASRSRCGRTKPLC